jgi:uncharacterized membrane protein
MKRSQVLSGYVIAIAVIAIALGGALSAWGVVPALALAAMLLPALVAVAGAHLFVVGAARILSELRGADAATRPVTSAARRCA